MVIFFYNNHGLINIGENLSSQRLLEIQSSFYSFLLDEKGTKESRQNDAPPALPNRKPHGNVSDMERCMGETLPFYPSFCKVPYTLTLPNNAFHLERKRPCTWG
jgi:hypothetical protein